MASANGSGRLTPAQLEKEEKKRQKMAKRLARKCGKKTSSTQTQSAAK